VFSLRKQTGLWTDSVVTKLAQRLTSTAGQRAYQRLGSWPT
jgi:hypothetical protein